MSIKLNGAGGKVATTSLATNAGLTDKNKKWQMELLMERLRAKSAHHKTFPELSKAIRMSMLEKRYALDAVEKANLQKCLDSMQHCIKVTTRQGLIERLESLSRQLGLKFMEDKGLFISSDMFYLEIILDASGTVQDVKVHHECKIEQQSCSELVNCLVKGDFADFTSQLEGLSSIYQLNAESKIKSKAFVTLQALETDLANLYKIQTFYKDPQMMLLNSSVGILQIRRGGHPMKLTYFVSPYELLDLETKSQTPLTIDLMSTKPSLGMCVTVNLEASAANKLQNQPILTITNDAQGHSTPTYAPIGTKNSIMLPATFVLRLNKPIPICSKLTQQIQQITDIPFNDQTLTPMMSLITMHASDGEYKNATKGIFVSLPDQTHCYFMTENKNLQATIINSVPFTEPSHVPQIIKLLRQQAVFNVLISSCIRITNNKQDIENTTMFEVSALSWQRISVALEHPYEESMATIEFNLTDCANITCKIYSITTNYDAIAIKLSKIVQQCMSIPVTLRALLRSWEIENKALRNLDNGNFNLQLGPSDPGGRNNNNGNSGANGNNGTTGEFRDIKIKTERNGNGGTLYSTAGVNAGGNVTTTTSGTTSGNGRTLFPQQNTSSMATGSGTNTTSFVTDHSILFSTGSTVTASASSEQSNVVMNQMQITAVGSGSGGGGGSSTTTTSSSSIPIAHELPYTDEKSAKRRRTEDFWKSPKSELTNSIDPLLDNSNNSSDSNSLGTSLSAVTDIGVVATNTIAIVSSSPNIDVSSSSSSSTSSATISMENVSMKNNTTSFIDCNSLELSNSSDMIDVMRKKQKKLQKDEKNDDGPTGITKQQQQNSSNSSSVMAPSVSITPITASTTGSTPSGFSSVLTGLEKRLGIEIIPISSTPPPSIKSSITITPINTTKQSSNSGSSSGERKSSSGSGGGGGSSSSGSSSSRKPDDRLKLEKKKKRKRDELPMGPPDKMPMKQDPLSRPVSVSIKTTDGAPLSPSGLLRKFTNSPVHGKSSSGNTSNTSSTSISLTSNTSSGSSSSSGTKPTQKHSPAHHSSPKHQGISSPKAQYGTSSPKHPTSGSGSGKPSINALKTAANSPSSKSSSSSGTGGSGSGSSGMEKSLIKSSSSSSNRDGSRERDRDKDRDRDRDRDRSLKYLSSGSNSPKLPKSTVKLKQIDITTTTTATTQLAAATPPSSVDALLDASSSSQDSTKSASGSNSSASTKNRKGSLSAVIDKLKSAQHVSDDLIGSCSGGGGGGGGSGSGSSSGGGNQQSKSNMPQSSASFSNLSAAGISSGREKVGGGSSSPSLLSSSSSGNQNPSLKNSEYMIKPSSDGMKITINKTRTKELSPNASLSSSSKQSSGSSSGSNSPKTHTGLKPGVNSGPASKKPSISGTSSSQNNNKISSSNTGNISQQASSSSSSSKLPFQRSSSSGSLPGSSSTSSSSLSKSSSFSSKSMSSTGDTFGKKDRNRLSSSTSSSSSSNKNSMRHDHVDVMKIVSLAAQSQSMDGYMKTFDTKFQIPKLSARVNADDSNKKESHGIPSSIETTHNSPMTNLIPITTSATASTQHPSQSTSGGGGSGGGANTQSHSDDAAKMLMNFFSSKDKYGYGLGGKFGTTNDSATSAITSQYMNNTLASMSRSSTPSSSSSLTTATTSPKYSIPPDAMQFNKDLHIYKSSSSDGLSTTMKEFRDKHFSLSNPTTPTNTVAPPFPSPLSFTHPSIEKSSASHPSTSSSDTNSKINHNMTGHQSMRPPSAPPISAHLNQSTTMSQDSTFKSSSSSSSSSSSLLLTSSQQISDSGALDFSSPSINKSSETAVQQQLNKQILVEQRNSVTTTNQSSLAPHRKGTPSPSVQLHIVKSPVPSPLVVNPSPHSNSSPCITDDELMDEALVGIGGK